MGIDITLRTQLAEAVIAHLRAAVPGSEALVRGSLAENRADPYSDVDLLWDVPDAHFSTAITDLPVILDRVRPIASLRLDPDFQRSAKRRLVFVRFSGIPLFWRVDLDVFARSVGRDPHYDWDNLAARGADWSLTESGLMNAIAAVKAHRRGRDDAAAALLERAEDRVGVAPSTGDVRAHRATGRRDFRTRPDDDIPRGRHRASRGGDIQHVTT